MTKETFYKILIQSTPEEINNFISSKGKKKPVNAITFTNNKTNDSKGGSQYERDDKGCA